MRSVENAECRKREVWTMWSVENVEYGKRGMLKKFYKKVIKRLNEKIPYITPLSPARTLEKQTIVNKIKNRKISLLLIFKITKLSTRKTRLSNSREINTRGN